MDEAQRVAAQRRVLIAQRSPIQKMVDSRPRCGDCGRVLVLLDYQAYWDGDPKMKERREEPRCCERCAESP